MVGVEASNNQFAPAEVDAASSQSTEQPFQSSISLKSLRNKILLQSVIFVSHSTRYCTFYKTLQYSWQKKNNNPHSKLKKKTHKNHPLKFADSGPVIEYEFHEYFFQDLLIAKKKNDLFLKVSMQVTGIRVMKGLWSQTHLV